MTQNLLWFSQEEAYSSLCYLCVFYTNLKTWDKNIQIDHSFFFFLRFSYNILKTLLLYHLTKVINFCVEYLWHPFFYLQDKYSWKLIVHRHIKVKKLWLFIPNRYLTSCTYFVHSTVIIENIAVGISKWWLSICYMKLVD